MNPNPFQKLRVFWPQVAMVAGAYGAGISHVAALGPLTVILGLLAAVTTIAKGGQISIDGWGKFVAAECPECRRAKRALAAIEKDRDELREAIAVLKVPQ